MNAVYAAGGHGHSGSVTRPIGQSGQSPLKEKLVTLCNNKGRKVMELCAPMWNAVLQHACVAVSGYVPASCICTRLSHPFAGVLLLICHVLFITLPIDSICRRWVRLLVRMRCQIAAVELDRHLSTQLGQVSQIQLLPIHFCMSQAAHKHDILHCWDQQHRFTNKPTNVHTCAWNFTACIVPSVCMHAPFLYLDPRHRTSGTGCTAIHHHTQNQPHQGISGI